MLYHIRELTRDPQVSRSDFGDVEELSKMRILSSWLDRPDLPDVGCRPAPDVEFHPNPVQMFKTFEYFDHGVEDIYAERLYAYDNQQLRQYKVRCYYGGKVSNLIDFRGLGDVWTRCCTTGGDDVYECYDPRKIILDDVTRHTKGRLFKWEKLDSIFDVWCNIMSHYGLYHIVGWDAYCGQKIIDTLEEVESLCSYRPSPLFEADHELGAVFPLDIPTVVEGLFHTENRWLPISGFDPQYRPPVDLPPMRRYRIEEDNSVEWEINDARYRRVIDLIATTRSQHFQFDIWVSLDHERRYTCIRDSKVYYDPIYHGIDDVIDTDLEIVTWACCLTAEILSKESRRTPRLKLSVSRNILEEVVIHVYDDDRGVATPVVNLYFDTAQLSLYSKGATFEHLLW